MNPVKENAKQLNDLIGFYAVHLKNIEEEKASAYPAPGKWSKKEELGHLIDSSQNNLRRFLVSQYESQPNIVYRQDEWVKLNGYQSLPFLQLSRLWLLLNQQIAHVLEIMNEEMTQRICDTGKKQPELHTLEWLAADYILHLRHHMNHLLELEPVAY